MLRLPYCGVKIVRHIEEMKSDLLPSAHIEVDLLEMRIGQFVDQYGEAHLMLLYHAAFPLSLTPDLLYYLRANIQINNNAQNLIIPWTAISDVLLSSFCEEVGHNLYEFNPGIRCELLRRMGDDPKYGEERIKEIAGFILVYADSLLHSSACSDLDFAKVLRVGAISYLQPQIAARELAESLNHSFRSDFSDLNRVAEIVQRLAEPLASYPMLLDHACGLACYARGNAAGAIEHFQKLLSASYHTPSIEGIRLSVPEGLLIPSKIRALLPPWLWLWLLTYLIDLPAQFSRLQQSWAMATPYPLLPEASGVSLRLLGLNSLLEIVPVCALFLGVIGLAFFTPRATYVEKQYALKIPKTSTGTVAEIINFLQRRDPSLQVKINPLMLQLAFLYPLGIRKTGLAIGAPLLKQWRADQPLAESILLRELAHHGQGDTLLTNLFIVLSYTVALYRYVLLAPFLIAAAVFVLTFWSELNTLNQLEISWLSMIPQLISHVIANIISLTFGALLTTLNLCLLTMSVFIMPLSGLWCSVLNADQAAAQYSRTSILDSLSLLPKHSNWRHCLRSLMLNPPVRLRMWFLGDQQKEVRFFILLLVYPLTYLLRFIILSGYAALNGVFNLSENLAVGFRTVAPVWLLIAIVLATWPMISVYWERLFTRVPRAMTTLNPMPYWISAGVVLVLAIVGYGNSV